MALPTTEIVAWWGAILSTIVLAWDIVKWWLSGPRLRITVQTNMKTVNIPEYDGMTLVSTQVDNYGDRPTTITGLGFIYYSTWWKLLRKQSEGASIVGNPSLSQPIPFELKQGSSWRGLAQQTED